MEWLWILLFGGFVSLSDQPMDLAVGTHDVPLQKPLFAITPGASLHVDVTSMVPKDEMTVEAARKWVERSVAPGCVKAALQTDGATTVQLEFKGGFSSATEDLHLILSGPSLLFPWGKTLGS